MHTNFDAVYQGDSKFVSETSNHQLHLSDQSSLTSETRHFDAQLILLHILRSSKYIKLIYVFVSAHVKIGV